MEGKSNHCKFSETDSKSEENAQKCVQDKETAGEAGHSMLIKTTRESSCQTELDEILRRQLAEFEDEWEHEREEMEREFIEEKDNLELRLRNEYNEIIKAKDEVIRVLTEEKDFFWCELRDLRKSFDLFTRHVHSDVFQQLSRENEKKLGNIEHSSCHDNNIRENAKLLTVLRKQEEVLLGSFEREKAAMSDRFEGEKSALRKVVEDECEAKYAFERAYLLQSIEVLKEGLDSLRLQKDQLAKIFEGEKNALELSFKRKEDELRQNLKLELQRKIIQAQKPWTHTKI